MWNAAGVIADLGCGIESTYFFSFDTGYLLNENNTQLRQDYRSKASDASQCIAASFPPTHDDRWCPPSYPLATCTLQDLASQTTAPRSTPT
jgi:hypothetical protein